MAKTNFSFEKRRKEMEKKAKKEEKKKRKLEGGTAVEEEKTDGLVEVTEPTFSSQPES